MLGKVGINAYKVQLPETMKVHLVFYVTLLELVAKNPIKGQVIPSPPQLIFDSKEEYEINKILNSWMYR